MHPSKILAGWLAALWVVLLVAQPERTTTVTANVTTNVVEGVVAGLETIFPDETLPTAAEAGR